MRAISIYRQTVSAKINAGQLAGWGLGEPWYRQCGLADTRYNLVFEIVAGQREFYKGLLWYGVMCRAS